MSSNSVQLNKRSKAALWFTVCSFLQKGISFITVPIFTRLMPTEQYGTFTIYISWYQILNIISSLYLFNGVYDNGLSKFDDDRDKLSSTFLGLTLSITTVEFFVYCLLSSTINKMTGLSSEFIILMFVEALFTPALAFWSARQRFEYKYKRLVAVTLVKSVLSPLLGIYLVNRTSGLAIGRVISTVTIESIFGVIFLIVQFRKGKTFFDKKYWNYGAKLAIPIIPHYLSGMVLNQGDRIVIDRMVGKSEVALYGLASSIGMLVQIFVTAVNSAITPWMYNNMKKGQAAVMKRSLNGVMCFIAIISVGLMLVCPEVTLIFGSEKYSQSVEAIPPIAASVFFIFLYGILSFPEFYFEKTKFLAASSLIAACINIVLNILFIPIFGYVAAGYTTLFCYMLYALGHYIVSRRILQKNKCDSYVDVRVILALSCVMAVSSLLINRILEHRIIRFSIIAVFLIAAFLERKKIIDKLKDIRSK